MNLSFMCQCNLSASNHVFVYELILIITYCQHHEVQFQKTVSARICVCLSPQRQWLGLGDGPRLLCDGGERGDKEKILEGGETGGRQ